MADTPRDPLAVMAAVLVPISPDPTRDAAAILAELARHGLAVVPVEPTYAMLRAAGAVDDRAYANGSQHGADDEQIYAAMVAAASQEPPR